MRGEPQRGTYDTMTPLPPSPRLIPSVEQVRQRDEAQGLEARHGREAVTDALRQAASALREALGTGSTGTTLPTTADEAAEWIIGAAAERLRSSFAPSLRPVINATGVVVHTNLGRAPISEAATRRVVEIARGYSNLEYDLEAGARGRRDLHAEALLTRLTGAEAAVVVNNNAAATLLLLAALARGREVLISRGELVEIGGGFRVPEIMAQSGAILREVGTTNRTRAADYAAAVSDRTALILRVHPSNFRMTGFTERPDAAELARLGRQLGVRVAEDLGSGNLLSRQLVAPRPGGSPGEPGSPTGQPGVEEPTVAESVAAGFDVVCFSGDKLLGGPQSGILLGRRPEIDLVRRHPLMRAFRVDKMTYAALEATLLEYAAGRATRTVPVAAMLSITYDEIAARASRLAAALNAVAGLRVLLVDGYSTVGGGSAPGSAIATRLVALDLEGLGPDRLEARLRRLDPPIIGRIEHDRVVLDLRTVLPDQDEALARLLAERLEDRRD